MLQYENQFAGRGLSVFDSNLDRPRHRWYTFKEGFSGELVREALASCGGSGLNVLDPFAGSGTTLVEAASQGHAVTGIEVNPFLAFTAITKCKSPQLDPSALEHVLAAVVRHGRYERPSSLEGYSTFCETAEATKWLFNRSVLRGFAGLDGAITERGGDFAGPLRLALFSSLMENCNARRDGKCLRYRRGWETRGTSSQELLASFRGRVAHVLADLEATKIDESRVQLLEGDARKRLQDLPSESFDLVVTSPPYLNSFDYSDVYRPELFVGGFVKSNAELMKIRLRTVRSHVQANWALESVVVSGMIPPIVRSLREAPGKLWSRRLPDMVQAYFADMAVVLKECARAVRPGGQAWLVVSTSAYAGVHIPVDLILADCATQSGWTLRSVNVLRELRAAGQQWARLGTGERSPLRESLVVLCRQHTVRD